MGGIVRSGEPFSCAREGGEPGGVLDCCAGGGGGGSGGGGWGIEVMNDVEDKAMQKIEQSTR